MRSQTLLNPKDGTESISAKVNLLISYLYWKKDPNTMLRILSGYDPNSFRLMLDSGAYSAWTLGTEIDMGEYIRFIKSLPSHWDTQFIQLDVIGDPVKTKENWDRMLDAGINALPVFTRGGDLAVLDEYYAQSPLVMFGGIVSGKGNKNYIRHFMENNKGRPVHWLGFSEALFIRYYKPASVDCSTITAAQRFGHFMYYAGGGKIDKVNRKDFARAPSPAVVRSCLRVGFTRPELAYLGQTSSWYGGATNHSWEDGVGRVSFMSHVHHLYRGLDMERVLGTRYYLAQATSATVEALFRAYEFLQERGRFV